MNTPTLRAIKCSERMPTREDANDDGCVLALYIEPDGAEFHLRDWECVTHADYWFPLNRSAIATDAEEQRGEGS